MTWSQDQRSFEAVGVDGGTNAGEERVTLVQMGGNKYVNDEAKEGGGESRFVDGE